MSYYQAPKTPKEVLDGRRWTPLYNIQQTNFPDDKLHRWKKFMLEHCLSEASVQHMINTLHYRCQDSKILKPLMDFGNLLLSDVRSNVSNFNRSSELNLNNYSNVH